MAEAKGKDNWQHTSTVLALLANINRDPKKQKAFTPDDFNPYRKEPEKKTILKGKDLRILKDVFVN